MAVTPNALVATAMGDPVVSTLRDLGRLRFSEFATDLQEHTAFNSLLRENRVTLSSGIGIQFNVMVNQSSAARNFGLDASDVVNNVDLMTNGTADWRNTGTNYALIRQILAMNREPSRIVSIIQEQRIGALISLAELMEANFWGPPVALADNTTPWGVNTWFVKNATEGFFGSVPSGYTVIGGINPTTYPRWKNWTSPFTFVTKDDLIRHMRLAAMKTNFKPPVSGIPAYNTGDDYGFYSNITNIQAMEEVLESQNENLGRDVASMDGKVLFRNVPVKWIPFLDADTTNPVYGINWGEFKTFVLESEWLRETVIPNYPGQHNWHVQFIDCTYQWVCRNRRRNFVISNGTSYPA